MLWRTEGKWGDDALELVKLKKDHVVWQLDLLKAAQREILRHTEKASPDSYRLKKQENKGNGIAFPEGFTVWINTDGEEGSTVSLPLKARVLLTSNPKESRLSGIENISRSDLLESELDGVVDADGQFKVTRFKLLQKGGKRPE